MAIKFEKLKKTIVKCNKCPRLVKFRKKISTEKRKQYINETYWGKPVTGFGDRGESTRPLYWCQYASIYDLNFYHYFLATTCTSCANLIV